MTMDVEILALATDAGKRQASERASRTDYKVQEKAPDSGLFM